MSQNQKPNSGGIRLEDLQLDLSETQARLSKLESCLNKTEGRVRDLETYRRHVRSTMAWRIFSALVQLFERLISRLNGSFFTRPTQQIDDRRIHHKLLDQSSLDPRRETILIVSHDASRTGAPILAWNIARRLGERYNIVALILGDGELVKDFKACCCATVGPVGRVDSDSAESIIKRVSSSCSIAYAVVNSIESFRVIRPLAQASIPVVSLIHEFSALFPLGSIDALDWATKIVFSTNATADAAKKDFPQLASRPIEIIPQGRCDLPLRAVPSHCKANHLRAILRPSGSENALVVLGMGSVTIRKGVDLFLACATALSSMDLIRPVRFVWIGKGFDPVNERTYSPYLAEQIARSGLESRVAITGAIENVEPAYAMSDLFLLSSRLDALPHVAVDAAFYSMPVVCFEKSSGIAALFATEEPLRSCVVPYLDVYAAAQLIAEFANDEAKRKSVGVAMRRFADVMFNMDHYISRLDQIGRQAAAVTRRQERKS